MFFKETVSEQRKDKETTQCVQLNKHWSGGPLRLT